MHSNQHHQRSRIGIFSAIVLTGLITAFLIGQALAGPYPDTIAIRYAGMVKPQRYVVDYTGVVVQDQYSTVWTGNYLGGGESSGRHTGVDITEGDCQTTEIRAIAEGTIVAVVNNWQQQNPAGDPCGDNFGIPVTGTWGNYVIVRHDDVPIRDGYAGPVFSIYAHLFHTANDATLDDKVLRGTVIGYQGSTGRSTNEHLHFQMDRDKGESTRNHPYSGFGPVNDPYEPAIAEWTFNPMRFVQAHLVQTTFSGAGACTEYFTGMPIPSSCENYEPEIDHEWFITGPVGFPADNFSARWEGTIQIPQTHSYWVYVTADDGVRLWIDNSLVLDQWQSQSGPQTYARSVSLTGGTHQIKMEYFEATGGAVAQLAWHRQINDQYLPVILKYPTLTPSNTPTPTRTPTRTPTPPNTPTPTPTPTLEPCEPSNNTFSGACSITSGTTYYYYLTPAGDEDWFKFSANLNQYIDVYLQSIPPGTNYDIALYSPSGVLRSSSTNGGNADEYILCGSSACRATSSGEHRVRVYSSSGSSATDSYLVKVSVTNTLAGYPGP